MNMRRLTRHPSNNAADCHLPDVKAFCQLVLIRFARVVGTANLPNLGVGEFRIPVFLAGTSAFRVCSHTVPVAARGSRLSLHVVSVYLMRSQEQVRSVHAKFVVAGVAHKLVTGVETVLDKVRNAVCAVVDLALGELTITARHPAFWQPQPALVRAEFEHLRPKPSYVLRRENRKNTILYRHGVTSDTGCFVLGPRRCLEHLRGLPILPQVAH